MIPINSHLLHGLLGIGQSVHKNTIKDSQEIFLPSKTLQKVCYSSAQIFLHRALGRNQNHEVLHFCSLKAKNDHVRKIFLAAASVSLKKLSPTDQTKSV